uniref:uncharacterized protein LOC113475317 n=1 Tax=Ciona intestinalis TaxID=7719 RepID=UPI000EF54904|nr:uncharacterized protein LOC113475317 [Ciona intestinalis]|eukprot:XP_026695179.1 uncharacterized protein LOC113475317 [Ciona intestinalis]
MTFNFDKCHGITLKIEKEDEDRFNKKKVRPFQAVTTQAGSSHSSGFSPRIKGKIHPPKNLYFKKKENHTSKYLHFFIIVYGSKTECEVSLISIVYVILYSASLRFTFEQHRKKRGGTEGESGGGTECWR